MSETVLFTATGSMDSVEDFSFFFFCLMLVSFAAVAVAVDVAVAIVVVVVVVVAFFAASRRNCIRRSANFFAFRDNETKQVHAKLATFLSSLVSKDNNVGIASTAPIDKLFVGNSAQTFAAICMDTPCIPTPKKSKCAKAAVKAPASAAFAP